MQRLIIVIMREVSFSSKLFSHLVDQVASGGGLPRVDVANDDDVDMDLLLSHDEGVGLGMSSF